MMQTQAQAALRREEDPAIEALRELFQELMVYEQPLRHMAELIAGTDIRYPPSNPDGHALTGTFAPDLTLQVDGAETSVAKLMYPARPIFLDLADRPDLREAARDWEPRVDIHTAQTDDRPADGLLIRPDAYIAWAAGVEEPTDTAVLGLREALSIWFGAPAHETEPGVGQSARSVD
jgi:hypothetical protein